MNTAQGIQRQYVRDIERIMVKYIKLTMKLPRNTERQVTRAHDLLAFIGSNVVDHSNKVEVLLDESERVFLDMFDALDEEREAKGK